MKDKVDILYVEDNVDYIGFVKKAISKISDKMELHTLNDGSTALDFFSHRKDKERPALILLDIDLPGVNGLELVKRIRSENDMAFTPVIMFSSSDNPADVKKAYENGANAYVIKPSSINPLVDSLRSMCEFWLGCNYSGKMAS